MNILITGVAGFIGSNFAYYMTNKYPNYNISGVDNLTYAGNYESIKQLVDNKKISFYKIDITNINLMDDLFKHGNYDVVINFAAESHVDNSIKNPNVFFTTNILGTVNLLNLSKKYQIKRYHQVSTDEVYGDLPLHDKTLKFNESSPIKPSSPYSASKASADLICLSYFRTYNLPITISRCTNNFGPYQFPEKLIPLMLLNIQKNQDLPVYGSGENVRDWIYVEDHCNGIDLIIHSDHIGIVYNLGGENELSNIELVKILCELNNYDESRIKFVDDRLGHDLRYAVSNELISRELNWKPRHNFKEALLKTVNWYSNNKDWMESIINKKNIDNKNVG